MNLMTLLENANFGNEVSGKQARSEYDVTEHTGNDDEEVINDPEYMTTQFSSSLLVTYLYSQLQNTNFDEAQANQLENILLRINIVIDKFKEDIELKNKLIDIKNDILIKVVGYIEEDYDIDFEEFGLDKQSEDYESEVLSIYEFFIVNRLQNIKTFFVEYILQNKKAIVGRYKVDIPKANQTFRELRNRSDTPTAYLVIASAILVEDKTYIENLVDLQCVINFVQDHTYLPDVLERVAEVTDAKDLVMKYFYCNLDNVISSMATEVRSEIATRVLSNLIKTD